jgi:glycogen(starch) synthase
MAVSGNTTVVEVAYEVANKVGGIYTVIASKMENVLSNVKDYYTIGPYYDRSKAEFEEKDPPAKVKACFEKLRKKHGIVCRYGTWFIEGDPKCILIEPGSLKGKTNHIKKEMWESFKIDSLKSDWWFDEPLAWSYAAGLVIEELYNSGVFKKKTVAHFQEWLSGTGLLYLKSRGCGVKTVFTTHATVMGRAIAEVGREDLYRMIREGLSSDHVLDDSKAYEYNSQAKHLTEKASCLNSDVFTTVSETVALECQYILGRTPDVVLPNGLNMEKFPLMEDLSSLHLLHRDRMRRFLLSYFSPYYEFDAKNTLMFFIAGRFEYRNKGLDVLIDALGKMNQALKKMKSKKEVIVFIWVPAGTHGKKRTVMENIALFQRLEDVVEKEGDKIEGRIVESFAKGVMPKNLLDKAFLNDLRKMELQLKARHKQLPPITPFELNSNNAITDSLARNGLTNKKADKVKIVYYPAYLSKTDGLLSMEYYNAIIGCHLGVFPSYYEPWGYTPLETAALGLQSITTDLSGYGAFLAPKMKKDEMSIMILERMEKSYSEIVENLTQILLKIHRMTKKERGMNKIQAKKVSALADWKVLIKNYIKAYEIALGK